jgi:hypothetical protein
MPVRRPHTRAVRASGAISGPILGPNARERCLGFYLGDPFGHSARRVAAGSVAWLAAAAAAPPQHLLLGSFAACGGRALMGSKSRGKRAAGQGAKKALPDSGRTVTFQPTTAEWQLVGVPTNGLAGEHGEGAAVLAG